MMRRVFTAKCTFVGNVGFIPTVRYFCRQMILVACNIRRQYYLGKHAVHICLQACFLDYNVEIFKSLSGLDLKL